MANKALTLADLDAWEAEGKQEPKVYKEPTLADLDAWDKEAQQKTKPAAQQPAIPSYRDEPWRYGQGQMSPMNPKAITDLSKGVAQGAYDIVPGLERRQIGNESIGSEIGKGITNTLSMFLPGKALTGAGKLAELVPGLNKLFGGIRKAAETNKLLSGLGKTARAATEGALGSAMITPENRLQAAEIGSPLNVLTQGTIGAATSRNPFINTLARTALGGAAGAGIGSMTPYGALKGAEYGAGAGAFAPVAAKMLGISRLPPGQEVLNYLKPEDVKQRFEAGLRTGRVLTPSEASGVGRQAAPEASYARGGEAAIEKSKIAEANVVKEKQQIKRVLNSIYDRSTASDKNIRDMYEKAYKWNAKPEIIAKAKEDPIIESAFNAVQNDKAWRRKLQDTPENNLAYMDKVKKVIQDEEGKLLRAGEKEKAKEYTDARKQFTGLMDDISPDYKAARAEAQRSILRSQLQKDLVSTKGRGTDFYNKILKNDDKFDKLMNGLKNAPEAKDQLRDMKVAWEHLINPETPRGVYGKTETGLAQARGWINNILETWQNMTGNKQGIEATRFFNSPEWPKAFDNIKKIQDKDKRSKEMVQLLGKLSSMQAGSKTADVMSRRQE